MGDSQSSEPSRFAYLVLEYSRKPTKITIKAVMVTLVVSTAPARDGALKLGTTPGGGGAAGVFGSNCSIVEGYAVTDCFKVDDISGGKDLQQVRIFDLREGRQLYFNLAIL